MTNPRFRFLAGLALLTAAAQLLSRNDSEPPKTSTLRPLPAALYAGPRVLSDSLGRGETLSLVWERNDRTRAEMAAVVGAANGVFDVRQLRSGTRIQFFPAVPRLGDFVTVRVAALGPLPGGAGPAPAPVRDASRIARADDAAAPDPDGGGDDAPATVALDSVLIRIDADRTLAVRADAERGFVGELRETPVREVLRTHVGCIEGSLYGALETPREDFSLLALELDRIYGGLIDFYTDLHPGDCVALTFQTYVRPDGTFRLGRIEAAEFVNDGRRLPAVYFEAPDGRADYYDLDGKSLKRQFLRSPLKFTRISSGFTLRRFHPILKRYRAHPGIDYAAPAGTPVQAAGDGVVAFAGWKRGYGKVVELRHGKIYQTQYAHLSRIPRSVTRGSRVAQGDVIGYVGSTGLSTAPHLDYRFSKNGKFVNPLGEKLPVSEPVASDDWPLFAQRRDRAMQVLAGAYEALLVTAGPGGAAAAAPGEAPRAALPLRDDTAASPTVPEAEGSGSFGDD